MDDIQRWDAVDTMYEVSTGEWVTYADHVAAIAAARAEEQQRGENFANANARIVRDQSFVAGVKAAREAVAALPKGGMGLKAHELWRNALAAIDGVEKP